MMRERNAIRMETRFAPIALQGLTLAYSPLGQQTAATMAAAAEKWATRRLKWQILDNGDPAEYERALKLYREVGGVAALNGAHSMAMVVREDHQWITLKEVIEALAKRALPNIKPEDAMELAKGTQFSADDWWRGCTERERWENA